MLINVVITNFLIAMFDVHKIYGWFSFKIREVELSRRLFRETNYRFLKYVAGLLQPAYFEFTGHICQNR